MIFSHVIHALARVGRALIIAHRDELLEQAADKYRMVNPSAIIGKVGSGVHEYGGEVTVASIATISRPDHLARIQAEDYRLVIIDEGHHSAADGYQRVLKALPNAFKLYVTATPDRLDGKPLLDGKKPLYSTTIIDMVMQQYLCNFKAIAIQTQASLDGVKSLAGDFNEGELDRAVNTPTRNRLIVSKYQEHASGKRAVAFCVTISHAEALASAFNEAGIAAAVIKGDTPIDERKRLYEAYHDGRILVLCNVMVLTEGWDEPLAEVCILARPTKSRGLYVQMIGRVLRLAPGKECARILDITDNCSIHKLMPMNLRKALGKGLKDEESLLDTLAREEMEAENEADRKEREQKAEREALLRKLNTRRYKDEEIDLLNLPEWQLLENGAFILEVGPAKHRFALIPAHKDVFTPGFKIRAKLAPEFKLQEWYNGRVFDVEVAQWLAEDAANRLLADGQTKLLDRNAPWRKRNLDVNSKIIKKLKYHRIPFTWDMTMGEASDLIAINEAERALKKAAQAARKVEREAMGV